MKHRVFHSLVRTLHTVLGVTLALTLERCSEEKVFTNHNSLTILSGIHSLMICTNLIVYFTVGDTRDPLQRCDLFISKLKAGDNNTTGHYMNYQNLSNRKFRQLLKNYFHSFHIDLRDTVATKTPFVSVVITQFDFMFDVQESFQYSYLTEKTRQDVRLKTTRDAVLQKY